MVFYCTYTIMFPTTILMVAWSGTSLLPVQSQHIFLGNTDPPNSAKMRSTSQCFVETWPPHAQLATRLRVLFRVFTCFTLFHWRRRWFGLLTTPNKKQAAWNNYILMTTVPPKKKQNKLQDEAKSLPTKSKQTNRYTNKPNHPWTPNHFGIFNFSKRILEKKKTHVPKFQRFSGCPTSKKRRPTDSHFHCRTWRTLQRMVAPLVFESSLPKCESFHRYVGMLSHSL